VSFPRFNRSSENVRERVSRYIPHTARKLHVCSFRCPAVEGGFGEVQSDVQEERRRKGRAQLSGAEDTRLFVPRNTLCGQSTVL
jgi:hypothetical protein